MKHLSLACCAVLLAILAACGGGGSPFDVEVSGAMSFDTHAVAFGPNSTNEYASLELYDTNPDQSRPSAGGFLSIYDLPETGVGEYELRYHPGAGNDPVVVFSFFDMDRDGSAFTQNPVGTFTVTAFDGNRISCTFDFTAENREGEQIHIRGTLTDIPYNNELYTG